MASSSHGNMGVSAVAHASDVEGKSVADLWQRSPIAEGTSSIIEDIPNAATEEATDKTAAESTSRHPKTY